MQRKYYTVLSSAFSASLRLVIVFVFADRFFLFSGPLSEKYLQSTAGSL